MRRDPFRGHRFPRDVILLAVRWYCRFPLSYQDVSDLLAERGIMVDRATVFRWVPETARRAYAQQDSYSYELADLFIGGTDTGAIEDIYLRCRHSLDFLIKPIPEEL